MLEKILSTPFFNRILDWYLDAKNLESNVLSGLYRAIVDYDYEVEYGSIDRIIGNIQKTLDYKCKYWDKNTIVEYVLVSQGIPRPLSRQFIESIEDPHNLVRFSGLVQKLESLNGI